MNKRNDSEKYIYEIRLPANLIRGVKSFAEGQDVELDLCIEEILKEWLKACKELEKGNVKQLQLNLKF